MTLKTGQIERYYDSHLRDDEEVSQSFFHQAAVDYLLLVLKWLFFQMKVGIASNINFYHDALPNNEPLSPDIAVVDGLEIDQRRPDEERSYYIGVDGPAPRIVFEMSSDSTWPVDLNEKPAKYALIGVAEYIAFDPHQPGVWTKDWRKKGRLLGWRLDDKGQYQEITKDEDGRIYSEQLQSWLKVDDKFLRLYTKDSQLRLTRDAAEQARADAEQARADAEQARADATQARADQAEAQAKEALRLLDEFRAKLRQMGLDPDGL